MYNLIICGFDFIRTMELIGIEAERALARQEEFTVSYITDNGSLKMPVTAHIRTGEKSSCTKIFKGHADRIMSATAEAAIRNLDWLKLGGTVTVEEKPGLPSEDEQYPVSSMIEYIVKTT